MKAKTGLLANALAALLFATPASAQGTQTVEGAQTFLAQIINSQRLGASVFLEQVQMDRVTTTVEKKFMQGCIPTATRRDQTRFPMLVVVSGLATGDNECKSTVTGSTPPRPYRSDYSYQCVSSGYGTSSETVMPVVLPLSIDWSRATVARGHWAAVGLDTTDTPYPRFGTDGGDGRILITAPDARHGRIHLNLISPPDLADRVDYAVRFLQMSCDASASTGF